MKSAALYKIVTGCLTGILPVVIQAKELEIPAGDRDLDQAIVHVKKPEDAPKNPALLTESGERLPLQQEKGGWVFVLPKLNAHTAAKLKLVEGAAEPQMTATTDGDQIVFSNGKRLVTRYQAKSKIDPRPNLDPLFLRGGYLHPLTTPSGKIVTDDYPVNHLHHHGAWMAWTKATFQGRETDFWNMGQGKGKVDFVSLGETWNGPVEAGLVSHHKYTDLTSGSPIDVLNETWTVKVYASGSAFNVIDLEAEQTTAGTTPLELPIYHYGGLGIRGREEWNGKGNATFVTSGHLTDRIQANGQPAKWVRMTGKVEDGVAGVAVLSHPDNFRSPQPARIHPTEPFVCFAPQTNAAMSIQPGETYRAKYRFIISDGEADEKLLESLWQDYANPVKAVWKE